MRFGELAYARITRHNRDMLIALLKRLAVPVPIIALLGAALLKLKRQHGEKRDPGTDQAG
jgi:hypothetical protein